MEQHSGDGRDGDRVRFNVGGKIFETTITTLAKAGRHSYFGAMLDFYSSAGNTSKEHFIDRDSGCFAVLLNLLRTNELYIPPNISEKLLFTEADFYGLTSHLRAARWGTLDGNDLTLSHSISSCPLEDLKMIRASPDGGYAVVKDPMVHIYDWTLTKHPPIHLDYKKVNDMLWVDKETIVVGGCSGMGQFSAIDGKLQQRYMISGAKSTMHKYSARSIGFDSNSRQIFASCEGGTLQNGGIGVWDQLTGREVYFYSELGAWSKSEKLQWLDERNCLLVMKMLLYLRRGDDRCDFTLVDFRAKSKVWAWTAWSTTRRSDYGYNKMVQDAVAVKDTIYMVNDKGELGAVDMRGPNNSIQRDIWNSASSMQYSRSKLAFQHGQLFCSVNDRDRVNNRVQVFSGLEFELTSRIRKSINCRPIVDFSIGGDRLFALHEDHVVNVWETIPFK